MLIDRVINIMLNFLYANILDNLINYIFVINMTLLNNHY